MARSREPLLWALFTGGGTIAALFLPALAFVLWVAAPLGWLETVPYPELRDLVGHPLVRLFLFALVTLSLFHWAHRFRYTLYDGLQLYHLNKLIAILTYGVASALTAVAGYTLLTLG
jgi:fumarate reductase subunit D